MWKRIKHIRYPGGHGNIFLTEQKLRELKFVARVSQMN
jgi:hypothetical protein